MGTKIKYCLLFFLLIASSAIAQTNLLVYHTSGKVNIITNHKPATAMRGSKLVKGNFLELKQNATCMLIQPSGRSLQVTAAGVYSFEALQQMISKSGENNVSAKFFKYVYENLFSPKSGDQLGVTPVVFRGEELMRSPSDNTIIIGDAVSLAWKKPVSKSPVRLVVEDDANRILVDTVVRKNTSLQIYLSENKFISGRLYSWKAEEFNTRQPKEHYLHFIVAEKRNAKSIINDLNLLRDKNLSAKLKQQMQQDIFLKWKKFYADKTY